MTIATIPMSRKMEALKTTRTCPARPIGGDRRHGIARAGARSSSDEGLHGAVGLSAITVRSVMGTDGPTRAPSVAVRSLNPDRNR